MSASRYRVLRLLRRGGMGLLYEAWDNKLDRSVALKLVAQPLDPDACRRALLEAKAVTRVRSDHVVQVYDAGEAKELCCPYLVMELLGGEDLQAVIQRGPVPAQTAVDWILQACEALAHLNLHGLVHRDIKPANLFLERRIDGSTRLKLLDFGVAKDLSGSSQPTSPTRDGEVIGSLPYMAPEQLLDSRDVDVRADVWGLGAVLYELLAGQSPFAARTRPVALSRIATQPHTPLHRLPLELPEGLSDVVDRCLEKRREERWPNIAELALALEPFASPSGAALVPRVCAIQAAPRSSAVDLGGEPPRGAALAESELTLEEDLTGIEFGGLGEKGFVATLPAATLNAPPPALARASWARRTSNIVKCSGVAGPLAVAAVIALVAAWPSLGWFGKRRHERLAYSASHCLAAFTDYAVVDMTHQVGNPRGEYWNLYTNGWVAQQHEFSPGEAEVRISAAADLAGDELPHMIVSVDDEIIGEADIPSEEFSSFAFPFSTTGGWHSVRVEFSNDYLQGGRDRNLILDTVAIGQCSRIEP